MSGSSPTARHPYWSNPTSPASIAAAAASHAAGIPVPSSYRFQFTTTGNFASSVPPGPSGGGAGTGSGSDSAVSSTEVDDSPPQNLMDFIMASTNAGIVGHFDQEVGASDSEDDSMPPLEELGPPPTTGSIGSAAAGASSAAAADASSPSSPARSSYSQSGHSVASAAVDDASSTAAVASPKGAAKAYDSNDDDDDDSVIEIVDPPSTSSRDGSVVDLPPSGRTRSHDKRSASGSTAAGLKTTGLDDDSATTASSTSRGRRKRSAPGKSDDNNTDDKKPSSSSCTEENHSCSICLDVPSRMDVTTLNNCEHLFCFECIDQWAERENTCPLCKVRFTEIERVHKPPPSKRRKKGSGGKRGKSAATRATKKIKTRDQAADLPDNPLATLFESMEASGAMPRSIAELIFSGLGGIRVGGPSRNERENHRRAVRNRMGYMSARQSAPTARRDPSTGRFASSRRRGTTGSAAAASSAGAPGTSRVSITLNRHGPTSYTVSGPPPGYPGLSPNAAASAADANPFAHGATGAGRRTARRSSSASSDPGARDVPEDGGVPVAPLDGPDLHAANGGYDTFVRRARANAASSASSGPGRSSSSSAAARAGGHPFPYAFTLPHEARHYLSAPPTRRGVPPADTADTAIEIGDSDSDDDEVICVD